MGKTINEKLKICLVWLLYIGKNLYLEQKSKQKIVDQIQLRFLLQIKILIKNWVALVQ